MESAPSDLNRQPNGFTLIELLLAMALVTVVTGLAWIVMDGTRNVADTIQAPVRSPLEPLWEQLQTEFDHLLPNPVKTQFPALAFSDENRLDLVSLLNSTNRTPVQTEISYFISGSGLEKITYTRLPRFSQTNLLSGDIKTLRVTALQEEEELTAWPPEIEQPLPPRIRVALTGTDGQEYAREFFLPVFLKSEAVETGLPDSGNSP